MRFLSLIFSSIFLMANLAYASPSEPTDGAEYITLKDQQPVPPGKKIEVIEFFMYHCPACNLFDPGLAEWVKKQGDNIVFKRIHVAPKGPKDVEAHLFLTLRALGQDDALHTKVLRAWHDLDKEKRMPLKTDAQNIDWAVKNGIDKDKFVQAYNSPAVLNELADLSRIAANYRVDSTPTMVIDGRYQTSMGRVLDSNPDTDRAKLPTETLQVMDVLVAKARAAKEKK